MIDKYKLNTKQIMLYFPCQQTESLAVSLLFTLPVVSSHEFNWYLMSVAVGEFVKLINLLAQMYISTTHFDFIILILQICKIY